MDKMFIVYCQHNTSHGLSASIILMTNSLTQAIHTANTAELLGYAFDDEVGGEPFVAVIEAESNRIYRKKILNQKTLWSMYTAASDIVGHGSQTSRIKNTSVSI